MEQINKPFLSICIPTYNRAEYLKETIDSIILDDIFLNTNKIEIVISNNCSTDDTDELCKQYQNKFPDKIKYIYQNEPIFPDEHIFKMLNYGSGHFLKLNNDTLGYKKGSIGKILSVLKDSNNCEFFYFSNGNAKFKESSFLCNTYDDLLKSIGIVTTWIGGICIKNGLFNSFDNLLRLKESHLIQNDIYGRLFEQNKSILVYNDNLFCGRSSKQKGGYNIAEVFGYNYPEILKSYIGKNNGITEKIFKIHKKEILNFTRNYFTTTIDGGYSFNRTGYFKFVIKNFYNEPYFYYNIIYMFLVSLPKYFVISKLKKLKNIIKNV